MLVACLVVAIICLDLVIYALILLHIKGKQATHERVVWDLIDVKTRFLLASHMSFRRTTQYARTLVEKASKRAGKTPKVIITDKLWAYLDGIELAFGADIQHLQSKGFRIQPNTNLIERFHGTLKGRIKVMRGLKKPETALLFLDGWLIHYNFFRPHEALGDKTPAEKAGLDFPCKNWLDVVCRSGHLLVQRPPEQHYTTYRVPLAETKRKLQIKRTRLVRHKVKQRIKPIPALASVRIK